MFIKNLTLNCGMKRFFVLSIVLFALCTFLLPSSFSSTVFSGFVYEYEQKVLDGQTFEFTLGNGRLKLDFNVNQVFFLNPGDCRTSGLYTMCFDAYYEDSCLAHVSGNKNTPNCIVKQGSFSGGVAAGKVAITKKRIDLKITSSIERDLLFVNRPYTVQMVIENTGDVPLTQISVEDVFPSEIELLSTSTSGFIVGNSFRYSQYALGVGEKINIQYRIRAKGDVDVKQSAVVTYRFENQEFTQTQTPIAIKLDYPLQVSARMLDVTRRVIQPEENKRVMMELTLRDRTGNLLRVENFQMTLPPEVRMLSADSRFGQSLTYSGHIRDTEQFLHDIQFSELGSFPVLLTYTIEGFNYEQTLTLHTKKPEQPKPIVEPKADFTLTASLARNGKFVTGGGATVTAVVTNSGDLPLENIIVTFDAGVLGLETAVISSLKPKETTQVVSPVFTLPSVSEKQNYNVEVIARSGSLTKKATRQLEVLAISDILSISHSINKVNPNYFIISVTARNTGTVLLEDIGTAISVSANVWSPRNSYDASIRQLDRGQSTTVNSVIAIVPQDVTAVVDLAYWIGDSAPEYQSVTVTGGVPTGSAAEGKLTFSTNLAQSIPIRTKSPVRISIANPSDIVYEDLTLDFIAQSGVALPFETRIAQLSPGESIARTIDVASKVNGSQKIGTLLLYYSDRSGNRFVQMRELSTTVQGVAIVKPVEVEYELVGSSLSVLVANSAPVQGMGEIVIGNTTLHFSVAPDTLQELDFELDEAATLRAQRGMVNLYLSHEDILFPYSFSTTGALSIDDSQGESEVVSVVDTDSVTMQISQGAVVNERMRGLQVSDMSVYLFVGVCVLIVALGLFFQIRAKKKKGTGFAEGIAGELDNHKFMPR